MSAAFIWMGLVAVGLALILVQILLRKPNAWLLSANAATLALVLYGCCFFNMPWLVARHNVEHCQEVSGSGPTLDLPYLGSLGPQALLALERHRKEVPGLLMAMDIRFPNGRSFLTDSKNWRDWSFRAWRLKQYFANNPVNTPSPSAGGQG